MNAIKSVQTSEPSAPAVLMRRAQRAGGFMAWLDRELKEGGRLRLYLDEEKRRMPQRFRAVGRQMAGFQPNHKSSFRRLAALPGRLYHRWKGEDTHFFEDDNNLRSLKRDNPELPIFVGAAPMPKARFHKSYGSAPLQPK